MITVESNDRKGWLQVVWLGLEGYRETCIPEGLEESYDQEWQEICTAMAWIAEALEVDPMEIDQ